MDIGIVLIIIYYLAWVVINVMIASEKGRDPAGVVLGSIFLGPWMIYLYLLAVPVKTTDTH